MEKPLKRVHGILIGLFVGLAGCHSPGPPSTPQAAVRRQTSARLHRGMTEAEVAASLGKPSEFRAGNGTRDDVAVYRIEGQTFTIYFYRGRLTRFVSSQLPVNR
jgi:hypothetical protein